MREFIKTEALQKFDGDYNVLYHYIRDQSVNGTSVESALRATESANGTSLLKNIESVSEEIPLLNFSVPVNIENWHTNDFIPLVVIKPTGYDDQKTEKVKAYDYQGNVHWLDANEEPEVPVIVVGLNERMTVNEMGNLTFRDGFNPNDLIDPSKVVEDGPNHDFEVPCPECNDGENNGGGGGGGGSSGDTNWCRENQSREYLKAINCKDIGAYEDWVAGAPEIRVKIFTPIFGVNSLQEVVNILIEPSKRADVNDQWWYCNKMLHYWDVEQNGYNAIFYFDEEDEDLNIGNTVKSIVGAAIQLLPKAGTNPGPIPSGKLNPTHVINWKEVLKSVSSLSFQVKNNTDHIGKMHVNFKECISTYELGTIFKFKSSTN